MFLDKLTINELSILVIILLLIVIFIIFRWFFNEVRDICKRISGYIIFGQLVFVLLSWGIFLLIFVYYFFRGGQVDVLNIFLTVVVGFLGTIMGVFFSEKSFEKTVKDLEDRYKLFRDERYMRYKKIFRDLERLK